MSKLPRTIIDEILEQYESLRHLNQPSDSIAVLAVANTLRARGYAVITRSLYESLCRRPTWEKVLSSIRPDEEVTDDDTPGS